eukprot:8937835-Karenia_brevis.AAC.1
MLIRECAKDLLVEYLITRRLSGPWGFRVPVVIGSYKAVEYTRVATRMILDDGTAITPSGGLAIFIDIGALVLADRTLVTHGMRLRSLMRLESTSRHPRVLIL